MSGLEAAYDAVRAHLHQPMRDDATTREELRSVLWLVAEAVERIPDNEHEGMPLRDLGDRLTGVSMSAGLRALLAGAR